MRSSRRASRRAGRLRLTGHRGGSGKIPTQPASKLSTTAPTASTSAATPPSLRNDDTVEVIGNTSRDDEPPRGVDDNLGVTDNADVDVRDNDVGGNVTCAGNGDGDNRADSESGTCGSGGGDER